MKISISVIIIFTTLFCILPYLWFIFIGKNNNKKNEKLLQDVIKDENLSFKTKEQWNNNFIGLDESKNILLFIKLINDEVSFLKIDLSQLKTCEIKRKTRDYKKENKMETELLTLDLELTFLQESETIILNFYDTNELFSEDLELKRAEIWQTLIKQNQLKSISSKMAA